MKIIRRKVRNPLAEDFAKPNALDEEIVYRRLIVVEELLQFMKREGINRTELAERMGVGPSRITKILSGDENLTIDTLVRAGRAVGADLAQTFIPEGQRGHWTHSPKVTASDSSTLTVDFSPKKPAAAKAPKLPSDEPATRDADAAA